MTVQSLFTGHAGEFWVAGHLLRRGFNAVPTTVDLGIDILAHKTTSSGENQVFQIQVKTTVGATAKFTISRQKFQSYLENVVNIVVVKWNQGTEPKALVLPPSLLYMMTSGGFQVSDAPLRFINNMLHFRVVWHPSDRVFVANQQHEFTAMVNQFDRLEDTTTDVYSLPAYAIWSQRSHTLIDFIDQPEEEGQTNMH